jgi:hypothetical protein
MNHGCVRRVQFDRQLTLCYQGNGPPQPERRWGLMLRVAREYIKFALSALTSVMYHQV